MLILVHKKLPLTRNINYINYCPRNKVVFIGISFVFAPVTLSFVNINHCVAAFIIDIVVLRDFVWFSWSCRTRFRKHPKAAKIFYWLCWIVLPMKSDMMTMWSLRAVIIRFTPKGFIYQLDMRQIFTNFSNFQMLSWHPSLHPPATV